MTSSESIEDRKSDISSALQTWIVDKCRQLDITQARYNADGNPIEKKILDAYTDSTDRLAKLIERNLVPCVKRDNKDNVVF